MMNYIIPAVLTLIVGYILWQVKKERIALIYDLTESDKFPRDNGIGKYFVIKLRNAGNKAIEHINLKIAFDSDVIETASFSDATLLTGLDRSASTIKGDLPLLNPHEVFSITITTFSKNQIPPPTFFARAIGATALPKEESLPSYILPQIALSITIIATIVTGYMVWDVFFRPKSFKNIDVIRTDIDELKASISKKDKYETDNLKYLEGEPDSQQYIFSIFNRSGLSYIFPELIEKNGEAKYWKTGAFLMHKFLKDHRNRASYVSAMEKLVEIEEMAPSSLGFNLYLLGKMEQHLGNKGSSRKYLEECKKKAPLMYDYLMAQDPYYDTKSLEIYFQKKN